MMELGLATPPQVQRALKYAVEQTTKGREVPIGEALAEMGFAAREQVEEVLELQDRERQGDTSTPVSFVIKEAKDPLCRFICDAGLATPQQVEWARDYIQEMGKLGKSMSVWETLTTLRYATKEQIQEVAAQQKGGSQGPEGSGPA